jgi:hypothetical protein
MKIEISDEEFEINVKRFYFPCKATDSCPECGMEQTRDFSDHYLPSSNGVEEVYFCCYHEEQDENGKWTNAGCDHEWSRHIRLKVIVEVVDE